MDKPWLNEPDKKIFFYKSYKAMVLRLNKSYLCGYLQITQDNPDIYRKINAMYKETIKKHKSKDDIEALIYTALAFIFKVHGELTVFKKGWFDEENSGGEYMPIDSDKNGFVLGFDCAHAGDFIPNKHELDPCALFMQNLVGNLLEDYHEYKTYKTIEFVENELKHLVDQIEEYNEKPGTNN